MKTVCALGGADWRRFGGGPGLEHAPGVDSGCFGLEGSGTKISAAGENETACYTDHGEKGEFVHLVVRRRKVSGAGAAFAPSTGRLSRVLRNFYKLFL